MTPHHAPGRLVPAGRAQALPAVGCAPGSIAWRGAAPCRAAAATCLCLPLHRPAASSAVGHPLVHSHVSMHSLTSRGSGRPACWPHFSRAQKQLARPAVCDAAARSAAPVQPGSATLLPGSLPASCAVQCNAVVCSNVRQTAAAGDLPAVAAASAQQMPGAWLSHCAAACRLAGQGRAGQGRRNDHFEARGPNRMFLSHVTLCIKVRSAPRGRPSGSATCMGWPG
jgi:hypothetical protein